MIYIRSDSFAGRKTDVWMGRMDGTVGLALSSIIIISWGIINVKYFVLNTLQKSKYLRLELVCRLVFSHQKV